MDLCHVSITGFRCFAQTVHLKTHGKLVAILGPNEAGKSSILSAIVHLSNDNAPEKKDISRSPNAGEFSISGRYYLSEEDLKYAKLTAPRWLVIRKGQDGKRGYSIEPTPPLRDHGARHQLLKTVEHIVSHRKFAERIEADTLLSNEVLHSALDLLRSPSEDLTPEQLKDIEEAATSLLKLVRNEDSQRIHRLQNQLDKFLDLENEANPSKYALHVLRSRIPRVIEFDEESRDLHSSYAMEDLNSKIPLALDNLFDVAQVRIKDIINAYNEEDESRITTIENRINKKLSERFSESWGQSDVQVSIKIYRDRLILQAVDESEEYSSFEERSDGLRQFVALQAFTSGRWDDFPTLIIDEAEQRLHYDAQADLTQMLARQTVSPKIIYTTHSAGCLPEDLGNGVRLARPCADDPTTSEIINKFWSEDAGGLTPLLYGMGATTLAFFPTRRAVMVEGPFDMLLLPTMFREALSVPTLGFQFIPGLSENSELFHAPVIGSKKSILYMLDGDGGGRTLAKSLAKINISEEDIFTLEAANHRKCELEDFISPIVLIEAVKSYKAKYYSTLPDLELDKLPSNMRMSELENSFKAATGKSLSKVEVAYEILDSQEREPGRKILDSKNEEAFRALAQEIVARFQQKKSELAEAK